MTPENIVEETESVSPETLPLGGATCSLLARLKDTLVELKKLEDEARGPGKHEVFMGLRRAWVSVAHSVHHEAIREANV